MSKRIARRDFLSQVGTGLAVVSVPGVWGGCGANTDLVVPPAQPRVKPQPEAPAHTNYFERFGVDAGVISRVIEKGLSQGGAFGEVFLQHRIEHWVGMEDGAVNRAYSSIGLGAGIRVLKGDATGFAYCEDLTEKALLATAETAAAIADGPARARPVPLKAVAVPSSYAITVPWTDVGIHHKLPIVQLADKKARAHDSRIIKVTVYLADETTRILVANSEGLLVEDDQPMTALSVSCVALQNGRTETSYNSVAGRDGLTLYGDPAVSEVAEKAANYTVILLDAVEPPVGELPVVLATGITGILLHEAIGHGMEADFNRKGISIYADRIGKRIAPEQVTIVDDGTNPKLRGSINIDDEGVAAQRTVLVENGILRSYLHDRISSQHYGVPSTGSGRRQSFRYPPVPRMRNTYMLNGPHDAQEVIASVKKGLYAEWFSNGQVNIGAGDFTFYLKHGRLIENGKLGPVVKDANLIGLGPKVLEHVDMVANDMALHSGAGWCGKDGQRVPVGFGLPTIRAGAMSIGGRKS